MTNSWAEYNWRSLKSQPVFREVNKTWPIPWRQKEATIQRQLKCQQDLEKASQPPQNKVLSLGRSWAAEDRHALQRIQDKVLEPQNSVLMSWKGNRNNPERFPSLERFCLSFFARVGAKFEFAFNIPGHTSAQVSGGFLGTVCHHRLQAETERGPVSSLSSLWPMTLGHRHRAPSSSQGSPVLSCPLFTCLAVRGKNRS